MNKIYYFCLFLLFGLSACSQKKSSLDPYHYSIEKSKSGTHGAVASAHPLASKVGIMILKEGGNAFDAAIATHLALAVVYPGAGNLGGGGFMVALRAGEGPVTLDYREKAPIAASRDMYLDKDGNVELDKSQNGHLASGVPGTVAGIFAMQKYGRLSFDKLIQPAIDLAEKGFALTDGEARSLNANRQRFTQFNSQIPVFVREIPWKAGDTLIQKDLAETLKRIRDKGQAGFYEGETARLIVEEMKRGGGLISLEDLKQYQAVKRDPIQFAYKGYEVVSMGLPSSGGILLEQMMKMVKDYEIGRFGFHSPQAVQLMVEAERRAYADRAQFLGDRDFVKVPVRELVSDSYLKSRMSDYKSQVAGNSENLGPGNISPEHEETTHFSIYDQWGNAVAITTTLNGGYGSGTVVGGAGFLLNNEMDDFSAKPGVPNMYGALGTEANAIAPGKRMLSSMTPTLVLKEGKPYLVVGTPGGTTIPTSVFQTLLNLIEFDVSIQDAVDAPKFHHQWKPDEVYFEKGFPDSTIRVIREMGYKTDFRGQIGRTELIRIKNGKVEAVADDRGEDHAEAY